MSEINEMLKNAKHCIHAMDCMCMRTEAALQKAQEALSLANLDQLQTEAECNRYREALENIYHSLRLSWFTKENAQKIAKSALEGKDK